MRRMLKNKKVILSLTIIMTTLILSVSYATFVLSTGKVRASELLVAELLYGINIVEDGSNTSTIEGNKIIIPENTKSYFLVTVSSLNEIDSKYTLGYKSSSNNTVVKYTDKTPWTPEGYLEGYESTTHSKTVRIVIENKESSEVEVSLKVYGGYTFNSIESINLKDGYKTILGIYNEVVAINNKNLVNRIEEENKCKENEECKYSGGSINNYLQYPEDTDKSKNLWRIIGTYNIDNNKVAKIVSEEITTTKRNEITSSLTSFYKTLDNGDKYIESTNKFNCSESGCIESVYNKIGLISTYEYERIGSTSYLEAKENYFAINNTNIKNITKEGIKETEESTISGLKPSVYLKSEVKVKGSGISSDPYIIVKEEENDINIVAVTIDGEETDKKYSELIQDTINYSVKSITCKNKTNAQWDSITQSIKLSNINVPDYCTIDFRKIPTLYSQILADNPNVSTRTNFDEVFTSNTANTIYKVSGDLTENGKDVYYFAGEETNDEEGNAVKRINNWVKFGKDKDNKDLYWRIIRTNEDGSIRLLYSGNGTNSTDWGNSYGEIGTSVFSQYNTDPIGAGYMFGSKGSLEKNRKLTQNATTKEWGVSSTIKQKIDTWYGNGLNTKTDGTYTYDSYISKTAIYCNDRSGDGYTTSSGMTFAARKRLYHNNEDGRQPSYRCGYNSSGTLYSDADDADRFSASTTSSNGITAGNGYLKYPVALMTADEVSFAGALQDKKNQTAWYILRASGKSIITSTSWWTMSPDHTTNASASFGSGYSFVFYVGATNSPGKLKSFNASYEYKVRPVVSLKSCVEWKTGNGTVDSPYEVEINEVCAQREN